MTRDAGRAPGRPEPVLSADEGPVLSADEGPVRSPAGGRPTYLSDEGPHSIWLLDANLLIALTQSAHIHHAEAHTWFAAQPKRRWATCALTQLAFVRLTSNPKVVGSEITPAEALQALSAMAAQPVHEYWPDAPEPLQLATLQSAALVGHRQVTDAYLLGLATLRQQCLATLDRGLVSFAAAVGLSAHAELVSARPTLPQAVTPYRAKRVRSRP